MRNKRTNRFFSMVIVFAMIFTMMMPVGMAYAATITVESTGGATSVVSGETLHMSTSTPSVTWSVAPLAGGTASITPAGLLTGGTGIGTVIVIATATDGSGIGTKVINVTAAPVAVTGITVTSEGNANTVANAKTLQMSVAVLPANATDKTVNWLVIPGTGTATIDADTGLLTGTLLGTVTVIATAKDGSGNSGTKPITVTEPVTSIAVTDTKAGTVVNGATLQMGKTILPSNANQSVTWSVVPVTGTATITSGGLLKGTGVGIVTVRASADDGTGIIGSKTVTVTSATVAVTSIVVTDSGAGTVVNGGTLQMGKTISPATATNQSVTWSVVPGTGTATITTGGLLNATGIGTVTVKASANDGSGTIGTKTVTVSAPVAVKGIVLKDNNAGKVLKNGNLQMSAEIDPTTATNQGVTWTVATLVGGTATIDSASGLLKGTGAGTVTVKATANDGSGIIGTKTVTVTLPPVLVTEITVTDTSAGTVANTGTLRMSAGVLPTNATNRSVTWSVAPLVGGTATIDPATGWLTGTGVGTVKVTATANDGSLITGSKIITVTAVLVTDIIVKGKENAITVVKDRTLDMSVEVLPASATEKNVTWLVQSGTGNATIVADTGVLTGTVVGTVTVKAIANDGTGVTGTKEITVTAAAIAVTSITVTGSGGVSNVGKDGTLQMKATLLPETATDLSVMWSLSETTSIATISATGELKGTGVGVGTVVVKAVATGGSSMIGLKVITVNEPFVITAPILPTSTIIGAPGPMTFTSTSWGTGKGLVWNWTGITLQEQDTTMADTPTIIPYTHALDAEGNMTITPTIMLSFGKTYTLTIPAGAVTDSTLNPNSAFSFVRVMPTTGVSIIGVDLGADARGVSANKVITLTTNVLCTLNPVFPITLESVASSVRLSLVKDKKNIVVVPSEMLKGGTTYTLTIPAGALKDAANGTNEATSMSFTTAYNLNDLINNVYYPITLNGFLEEYSPRGLKINVPKRYLTKFDIAYSTNSTNPLTNVDITAEAEVAKINVKFGTDGPTYQAIKGTTSWNTGYEGSLIYSDGTGQDIIFEAFDSHGRVLEERTYIKLLAKGSKLDLSGTKKLNVTKTFADLVLSSGKLLTDILKQYSLDELTLSVDV